MKRGEGFFFTNLVFEWWSEEWADGEAGRAITTQSVSIVKDTFIQKLDTSLDRSLSGAPSLIEKSPKQNQPHDFCEHSMNINSAHYDHVNINLAHCDHVNINLELFDHCDQQQSWE